ncbi:MAG: PD-(D/E)XK nuclease family protein [Planctomycetota bacterium]|jgi:ATP-dependent helicase/nuclease subunit B
MSVQFILGRSGVGKTSYCISRIADELVAGGEQQGLILLVPEQATYQAERAILADKRVAGYHRLYVVSFSRLQFLLLGGNTARPALSRLGRQMVIQRILRQSADRLKVFGSSVHWPGLGRQMAQTIAELHRYGKTTEDIEGLVGELGKDERDHLAALKFADIAVVLEEYLRFIEGKFVDPDVQLAWSCRAVAGADFVRGAKLWVDGFAGFTAVELAVLTELLKVVADAQIALCLDPSAVDLANPAGQGLDPISLFGPTERTYADLLDVIKKSGMKLAEPVILEQAVRFSNCPQLAHIERHVFGGQTEKIKAAGNIRVVSAPNARAEVQFVARQILELVRQKGYRYRDIAVIASDLERYQHYIRASLEDCGIPFFIDKRRSLSQHPVVVLISSALQVVSGGFSANDVFAYLKSDLVPVERCEVDLLENYCLAFGVRGEDWVRGDKWSFAGSGGEDFDEQRVNRIREKVSSPLLELWHELCPADEADKKISAEQFTRIIFDFLERLGVRERVGQWIEQAVGRADYATVDEHRQFYDRFLDVFDELVEVFGQRQMLCQDWAAIVGSAFSQLELAFIPPTLDQVLVGSIERSRHPDLKAVFQIGVTERRFPVPVGSSGILTDDDRRAAGSADFVLGAGTDQKLAERQYLAYIAFTRPSEFLCVSYPLVDDKGSAVARSQFVANLESVFEDLTEESIAGEQIAIENVHNVGELADLLCVHLGQDASSDLLPEARASRENSRRALLELLGEIEADEELRGLGRAVRSAIEYDNSAQLEERIVEQFFGGQIRSSATRLGTFAACPYKHFARYVLELQERKEFKLEPLDVGVFYHRVLDGLLKELNRIRKDFGSVGDEQLLRVLREQIAGLMQGDGFISNFARHSRHNTFIIRSVSEKLEDCVLAIAQMVRAGDFRPSLSEVSFGKVKDAGEKLGEYVIELPGGRVLYLDGKIDRLDIAEADGEKVALVFDYKRSARSFSWSRFYYGLDMQLPIYMLAVRNASDRRYKVEDVAGAFYMPVEVSTEMGTFDKLGAKKDSFDYKPSGFFNGAFSHQIDSGLEAGWSKFYSFRITAKDGQYGNYAISNALKPEDFERVLRFTEREIVGLVEQIVSGRIDAEPYRLSGDSPCRYCEYKSVCHFDWRINDYRVLLPLGKNQVIEKAGTVGGR